MPNYDYKCNWCGHYLSKFQPMKAKPLKRCPDCKSLTLKRLIGPGSYVIFKGSGFYCNDYKKKRKPAEKAEE